MHYPLLTTIFIGHPLSCVLEWSIAKINNLKADVLSVLSQRQSLFGGAKKNLLDNRNTQILYTGELPDFFDADVIKNIYGYHFDLKHIENTEAIPVFNGSTVLISKEESLAQLTFLMVLIFH
jgi:hypothetical protein